MGISLALVALAAGFGGVTFIVEKGEQKAKTCSLHNRAAGRMARVLGIFCGIVAVALLGAAFFLRDL